MNSIVLRSLVSVVGLTAFLGVVHVEQPSASAAYAVSVPSVSVDFVAPARADISADVSYGVLKCFHPSATFISGTLGPAVTDANGRAAAYGSIDFRGALSGNSYTMTYVIHAKIQDKDTMMRWTPLTDNAPFVPNPDCSLREWTRVN